MNILKQIEAKNKGLKIIESCLTREHIKVAERYVDRYFDMFEDTLGFTELNNDLYAKKILIFVELK